MNFLGHNNRKWIATFVASIFFLFFWAYGPIQNTLDVVFEFEQNESVVKPVLITDKKEKDHYSSKEIGEFETSGHGFSLILDHKKNKIKTSTIIEFEENIITNSDYGNELKSNAVQFFSSHTAAYTLRQTESIFYAEINDNKCRYFYFQSKGISDHIKGYSGPINIGVFTTENGQVKSIHLVSSNETC